MLTPCCRRNGNQKTAAGTRKIIKSQAPLLTRAPGKSCNGRHVDETCNSRTVSRGRLGRAPAEIVA
jgi:hypothetical protein